MVRYYYATADDNGEPGCGCFLLILAAAYFISPWWLLALLLL